MTRESFGGLGEAWVPCALCAVLEADWLSGLSEILGGGGIHFPTPTARPVETPAIACHCLPTTATGHRVPCPPATRQSKGILDEVPG